MKQWIKERLKEKSTYIGISLILGAAGIVITPDQAELIGLLVMSIAGMSNVVIKESPG